MSGGSARAAPAKVLSMIALCLLIAAIAAAVLVEKLLTDPVCASCMMAPNEQVAGALSRAGAEAINYVGSNRLAGAYCGDGSRKNLAVGSSIGKKFSIRIS